MTAPGDLIDGKFEVLSQVGRGGMSRVWLVRDRRLNKLWAAKEIEREGATGGIVTRSLIVEANLMKRLDHPMLPRIVDIIEGPRTLYVVMDYVEGVSLRQALRERGRGFEERKVAEWGAALCDVLEYLHTREPPIVYRDMKPGNVMLREDGSIKLVDFGIAREYKQGAAGDTSILGTRGYAAPEQFLPDAQTDARADIYSLGMTLYVLLTACSVSEAAFLRPLRHIDPGISEGLERIVAKATRQDPAERYQSCAEMRRDLLRYEKLTEEYRQGLKRKLLRFRAPRLLSAMAAVAGVACVLAGFSARDTSFDALMAQARVASVETAAGERSEAERLCCEAMAVDPSRTDPYEELADRVYKADGVFSADEAARFSRLLGDHRGELSYQAGYARLCYGVGNLYFVYYGQQSTGEEAYGEKAEVCSTAGGAKAAPWFREACESCDQKSRAGAVCDLTVPERSCAEALAIIGEFGQRLPQALLEGEEGAAYEGYWASLETALGNLSADSPAMAQLRLCAVVQRVASSQAYLSGFRRAGVARERVEALLGAAVERVLSLRSEADMNERSAALCDSVIGEAPRSEAARNIDVVYGNVAAVRDGAGS